MRFTDPCLENNLVKHGQSPRFLLLFQVLQSCSDRVPPSCLCHVLQQGMVKSSCCVLPSCGSMSRFWGGLNSLLLHHPLLRGNAILTSMPGFAALTPTSWLGPPRRCKRAQLPPKADPAVLHLDSQMTTEAMAMCLQKASEVLLDVSIDPSPCCMATGVVPVPPQSCQYCF